MADSKVRGFFGAVVMWLLFTIFLLVGLGAMFTSFMSGLIMLIAACIFVPRLNRIIEEKTGTTVTTGMRAVVTVVCFSMFIYVSNREMNADRAEHAAQEALVNQEKSERAKQEKREYVSTNNLAILAEMNAMIDKQDYEGATALGSKYSNAGSFEIDQAFSKVSAQKAEMENKQRKAFLLDSLGSIKPDDYKALALVYAQLAAIDPLYQSNADKFFKLDEKRAENAKIREQAAAERARRQRMGLVWSYVDNEDSMSGRLVRRAYVSSTNTVDFKFPYVGSQRATLTVRKHPRWGTSVYVEIERGQFICEYDGCNLGVRFSKGNAQRMSASGPEDHSSTILFFSNASSFINQARKSDRVFIEANFYQEGSRVFEFDTSGLEWN